MTVPRVALLMIVITLLGVAAVVRLPGPEARTRSGGSRASPWLAFAAGGGAFALPEDWSAADPFTPHTPHHGLVWLHDTPERGARMALLRAPAGREFEVFLMFDHGEGLARMAERRRARGDAGAEEECAASSRERTVDGVDVTYEVIQTRHGPLPGKDVTLFLGWAVRDGASLVVNAGGRSADFELEAVLEIVRSLRLPR
ncbi:MAG: hypothetical protein HY812_19935 [Planctomycetes bacterium]|nr:hypothetical protein [Planctomycetota bacterium]